jgi:membrane peptidoglycan carboxypeptidase
VIWAIGAAGVLALAAEVVLEARTSFLQSRYFALSASAMTYRVGAGPSPRLQFPVGGPYDERLGYSHLPALMPALERRHFTIERQAVMSPALADFTARHGYAVYPEKGSAGLVLETPEGFPLYQATYPERVYGKFSEIPPLVVSSLLFVENRSLLDFSHPEQNPAVEWDRFILAAAGQVASWAVPGAQQGGGSTLATQTEKFEHSPGGLTRGIKDKLLQMIAASTRAYLDGRDTTDARKHIVTAYLNATPLSSRPGYGEIIGIADGLRAWYGTDFEEANRVLSGAAANPARKAEIYKQVLSLLIAQRRPSYYLSADHAALESLADQYLRLLGEAAVIGPDLRDAALAAPLKFTERPPAPEPTSFISRKAVNAIRTELLGVLKTPNLYSLDRYDLRAATTINARAQDNVSRLLARLKDPREVKALGLVGDNLLRGEDPARVAYSVVLYERQGDRNVVRVHADSLDEPFDINSGAKLILGSTAKLRTLVTYLDIVARLHARYENAGPTELRKGADSTNDVMTRWVASYMSQASDKSLKATLRAAMERRYSANPGQVFFTGGGRHVFRNFEKYEDSKVYTVEDAFANSINLVFVRLLRDVSNYYLAELNDKRQPGDANAQRQAYLKRFVDQESRVYLNRFYKDLRNRTPDDILARLAQEAGPAPHKLATVFRSLRPQASVAEFREFLNRRVRKGSVDDKTIQRLYGTYTVERYSLSDRAYIAKIHPLKLWVGAYLQSNPKAARDEVMDESADEREESYGWLLKSKRPHKQDVRIRIIAEQDAFAEILKDWRKQGYPFDRLVPSLATAIGSSGDRPEALSQLMGTILNDGVRLPDTNVERLHFATGTPYETNLSYAPQPGQRAFAPEIAAIVRGALTKVVSDGTAKRLQGAFQENDGSPLPVGGKTGTGDNRLEHFTAGNRLISSEAVDRTATFVFFLGDRFFGTVTAYVRGPEAAKYRFTSALSVQLLKALQPEITPLLRATPNT